MKNISLPSKQLYKIALVDKIELAVKPMRWKARLYEKNS